MHSADRRGRRVKRMTISLFRDRPFDDSLEHGRPHVPFLSSGRASVWAAWCTSMPGMLPIPPSAVAEVRFGVDEERRRRDDGLADARGREGSRRDRRSPRRVRTSRGASWPLASVNEHDAPLAGREHGASAER